MNWTAIIDRTPPSAHRYLVRLSKMRRRFERPGTLKLINRTGGGFLIGAGVLTALARRAA